MSVEWKANIAGFHLHEPILDRVDRFAERTASWLNLRYKANKEKKLAFIYYNNDLGQDDLMRGSPTGAFLDSPESAVRFLPRMKSAGYKIDHPPTTAEELIGRIKKTGRNIGPWNQTALEDMVNTGDPVLIPLSQYKRWFEEKLTPERREQMIKAYGPPPGKLMVVERQGQPFIVIPIVKLGNVAFFPQPQRGQSQDYTLLHSRDIPPPHNYLAFYWWLQSEFKADAVVHWGTHGSLELLPGKEAGLSGDDWTDVAVGKMPIVNLWIMDNLAEATLSRRRSYAALVDHMVPASIDGSPTEQYGNLRSDMVKFHSLEPGLLKEKFRKTIQASAAETGLLERAGVKSKSKVLSDKDLEKVESHLDELLEERTTNGLHLLGSPPPADQLPAYLVTILGRKFLEHIAVADGSPKPTNQKSRLALRAKGQKFLQEQLFSGTPAAKPKTFDLEKDLDFAKIMLGKLNGADAEIIGMLRALDGRYDIPGPGPGSDSKSKFDTSWTEFILFESRRDSHQGSMGSRNATCRRAFEEASSEKNCL